MFGSDSHEPSHFPSRSFAEEICKGAAVPLKKIDEMFAAAEKFARSLMNQ